MAKKILEDIKIKKSKIINIPNKEVYKPNIKIEHKENFIDEKIVDNYFLYKKEPKKRLHSTPQIRLSYKGPNKSLLILFFVIILIVSLYIISNKFLNANIEIVNKHQIFTLENRQFTASKDFDMPIHFELMIVPAEESRSIILTQTQDVSIKSKGEITLYNEYSTKAQNLPIHTYILDNSGKTYLTDKAVSIPGFKKDSTKIIPGSIKVGITAFLSGSVYNIEASDFAISSFKGTIKSKKIYGKSVTPTTGGAQGIVYMIGDQDKIDLDTFANSSFKNNLIKKAEALVPPGYILYPNASKYSYEINNNILSDDPKVDIKISGILSAVILKESDLSLAVIKNLLPNISEKELKEIETPDLSKLSFNFIDENKIIDKDIQTVSFSLSGNLESIWNPDINFLKNNLIGISKINIQSIFKQDPAIITASTSIFPPWQSYLPEDTSKINITIK